MNRLPQFQSVKGTLEILLAGILVTVAALAEETVFRGYLLLRFNSLTSSAAASIIISSAVFSLGHGYEGAARIAAVGFPGIILALIYVRRKA